MPHRKLASFSEELLKLMPLILRGVFRSQKDELGMGRISIPQFLSLDLLDKGGPLMMKDIARVMNVSLPATTGLINRLVTMKFVKRVYDEKDRRVIRIALTLKGKETVEKVRAQRRKAVENIFGKLTESERKNYLEILRKVVKVLYPKGYEK
ncbi:MAG: MarR family transcriptional regulator [Candidatus Omnitrophota bacterium]|nr:MAG: MarR family transcriptional regulator [Candidatus Omnitrophota bacterium]